MSKKIITTFAKFESEDFDLEYGDDQELTIEEPAVDKAAELDTDSEDVEAETIDDKDRETDFDDAVKQILDETEKEDSKQKELMQKITDQGVEDSNLVGFIEENDIYDFYLQHQFDINKKLDNIGFFDSPATKYGIKSLYDYVVKGTQIAFETKVKEMLD
jgi:hypothetical protein